MGYFNTTKTTKELIFLMRFEDLFTQTPMATSKCPTCGRVKMPHPGDGFKCTNVEGKGPYYFLFHPGFWVCVGIAGQRPL